MCKLYRIKVHKSKLATTRTLVEEWPKYPGYEILISQRQSTNMSYVTKAKVVAINTRKKAA